MKKEIETLLIDNFDRMNMDIPSNFDDILEFVYQDIKETADQENRNDADVVIGFRRWIESQSDKYLRNYITAVELQELEESNRNGMDWFDSYQDVDNFLFNELDKRGLEFVTNFEKPHLNTIASIKLLMCNFG